MGRQTQQAQPPYALVTTVYLTVSASYKPIHAAGIAQAGERSEHARAARARDQKGTNSVASSQLQLAPAVRQLGTSLRGAGSVIHFDA